MNEKTRKGIVFSVLILALIWAYFNFSGRSEDKRRTSGRTIPTSVRTQPQYPVISGALPDSLYDVYQAQKWGKNPFYNGYRPFASDGPTYSNEIELHLLGVVFRELKSHALINNNVVTVGDELEGYQVTAIYRDSVILNNGESTITLRVTKESS